MSHRPGVGSAGSGRSHPTDTALQTGVATGTATVTAAVTAVVTATATVGTAAPSDAGEARAGMLTCSAESACVTPLRRTGLKGITAAARPATTTEGTTGTLAALIG